MVNSIEEMVPLLLKFRSERKWEQFHIPKDLATAISIEASELLELFLWKERESKGQVKKDRHMMNLIIDEMADILIYLLFLSYDLGIDLSLAVKQKIEKNEKKYPKDEFKGRYKKF
jgi:NTP pyrophosphatase (non-canonical NTP hydrolase)